MASNLNPGAIAAERRRNGEGPLSVIPRVIGPESAAQLFAALGGVFFPVPKGADNNRAGGARFSELADVIGEDKALLLCAEYGGECIYIPFDRSTQVKNRNIAMTREFDAGSTINELVARYRLSKREIEKILNKTILE